MRTFNNNELRKRVDEVLYYIWDPIGVSTCPSARGEYATYVSDILKLLEQNEGINEISEHLEHIRTKDMELQGNRKQSVVVAKMLQEHKNAVKNGLA
jgi:hypothetical protein